MIPLIIDISQFANQMSFSQEEVKSFSKMILDRAAARYMYLWEKAVDTNLKSTRGFYKSGMKFSYIDDSNVMFELEGKGVAKLGLMIERGVSAFDIKEGMMNSPKAKQSASGGWYITVPFRMATSNAIAESVVFAGIMPKMIQKIAKQSGKTTADNMPDEFKVKGVREEVSGGLPQAKMEKYTHKNPIFEGVMKTKGGYVSMRRISNNSDENSWIHKGFEKRGFMQASLESLASEIPNILRESRNEFLDIKFGR